MQVGKKDMYEVQTYYTQPEKDWVFDETRRDTYTNPEWQKQKFGKVLENEDAVLDLLKKEGFLSEWDRQKAMEEAQKKAEAYKNGTLNEVADEEEKETEELVDDEDEELVDDENEDVEDGSDGDLFVPVSSKPQVEEFDENDDEDIELDDDTVKNIENAVEEASSQSSEEKDSEEDDLGIKDEDISYAEYDEVIEEDVSVAPSNQVLTEKQGTFKNVEAAPVSSTTTNAPAQQTANNSRYAEEIIYEDEVIYE